MTAIGPVQVLGIGSVLAPRILGVCLFWNGICVKAW